MCLLYLKYVFVLMALESFSVDCLRGKNIELCKCVCVSRCVCLREKKKDIPGHTFLSLRILFCIAASHQRKQSAGIATKTWTPIYRYIRKSITFLPFFLRVQTHSSNIILIHIFASWRTTFLKMCLSQTNVSGCCGPTSAKHVRCFSWVVLYLMR